MHDIPCYRRQVGACVHSTHPNDPDPISSRNSMWECGFEVETAVATGVPTCDIEIDSNDSSHVRPTDRPLCCIGGALTCPAAVNLGVHECNSVTTRTEHASKWPKRKKDTRSSDMILHVMLARLPAQLASQRVRMASGRSRHDQTLTKQHGRSVIQHMIEDRITTYKYDGTIRTTLLNEFY